MQLTSQKINGECCWTNTTQDRIQLHETCESICACAYESACVYMHMYLWVCARMYTYACMLSRWRGGALGEWWGSSIFVDQSQGQGSCSGPCSRWMEASDGSSLAGCSIPAGPHRLTATNPHHHLSPFFSVRPQGPVLKMPVHWDLFCALCNPTQRMQTHTHAHT